MSQSVKYNIELRDSSGNLKDYLTPFVDKASWEWKRIGGCGRCSLTINKKYRDLVINAADDIQIRLATSDNLLTNSNFGAWSGGVATGWTLGGGGSITEESTVVPTGFARSVKLISDADGCQIVNSNNTDTDFFTSLRGKRLKMVARVHADDASAARISIGSNSVSSMSSYHTGGGDWEELTTYHIIEHDATGVYAYLWNFGNTKTVYFTDIRLYEGSKLVYRGWVSSVNPSIKTEESIRVDVRGYFDRLSFMVIQDSGSVKTYTSKLISAIVDDIADNFIVANSDITKGTIDVATFAVDSLKFKVTVAEALKTLAELQGEVEYGVDEDLEFYWRNQTDTLTHKFFVGNNIEMFERRFSWDKLVNKIFFEGGKDSAGSIVTQTYENTSSQTKFFLAEKIVTNSAIVSTSVADQYCNKLLKQKSAPKPLIKGKIANTTIRIEDTIPLGKVAIYDVDYDQNLYLVGTTANGGSNLISGKIANDGSDALVGGVYKAQVDNIKYSLSDTLERTNIDISFGEGFLETAAKIKQLELAINDLRQTR